MTEKDIYGLCDHVKNLPYGQLMALCQGFFPGMPQNALSQVDMVPTVEAWLRAIRTPQERLPHVAGLYSRLASLDALKPWTLYCVDMAWTKTSRFAFLDHVAKSMNSDGCAYTCGYAETTSCLCCSILMSDDGIMTEEHRLVCFNLWSEHPFVAVYDAGAMVAHAKRLQAGLAAMGVDPERCLHGYYEKLSSAHAEVEKTVLARKQVADLLNR
ncbi:hypothetical protein HPB52_007482 [Rhipicephalus sanguineus]|uniref:Uncharacterized protein n=1 Tax=Rhipicephalus sanguineus TaxID=34632 RepID=A0A9D4PNG8_RHISA|nr:hypothetical protein HPB52_007482 [Rhipicephalus sanguineus]